MQEFKKALKEKRIIIGAKQTQKRLFSGELKKIFLTASCDENTRRDITRQASLRGIDVRELNISGFEVGVMCKKPFSISVVSY